MAGKRIVIPNYMPALDLTGAPVAGAKLYFYENETTTLKAIYTSAALSVQHPNPISASAAGVFPSIFADEAEEFSVAITDADGNPITGLRNRDNIAPSLNFLDGVEAPVSDAVAATLVEDTLAGFRTAAGTDLAANVNFTPAGTGAVVRTVSDKARDVLHASDFGVMADDAATDQSVKIQAAVNAAIALRKTLVFPGGAIRHDTAINVTGLFGGGFSMRGGGSATIPNTLNSTVFICNTGGVGWDFTGSQNVILENLMFDTVTFSPATPSTIAILQARATTSQYAQFNILNNVVIRMHTDMAANGGTGTYGLVNIAAEITSYRDIWFTADNPFAMYGQKPAWLSSPFVTIETGIISLSVIDFGGCTTFTGLSATRPLFLASLAKGVSFANFHAAGVYSVTMDMDGCDGVTVHSGRVEGASQIIAKINNCTNIYLTTDTTGGTPSCAIQMGATFNACRNIHLRTNYRSSWGYVVDSANAGSILRQLVLTLGDDPGTVVTANFPTVTSVVRLLETGGLQSPSLTTPQVTTGVFVNGLQTLGPRVTGFGAMTGTATKTAIATYTAPDIEATYTEATIQALADAVQAMSRRLKALDDAVLAHGLIGA